MEVIFADRLLDYTASVAETTNIATALMSNIKKSTCIISEEAWECNLEELLRIKRGQRWWTAVRGSPHVYTVRGKEAEVLMLLVGGPGVLVDERATTVLVLMLIIPSSVLKITDVRGNIFININIFCNIRYYFGDGEYR
jgi:hypothetical protein